MDNINERFRKARKLLNKSQDAFASEANRTRSEISNIEYGKTVPKPEVISAVCDAHRIDRVWLETGVGEPFRPESRDDKIAKALGEALGGSQKSRARLIRALAELPEELFPAAEEIICQIADLLSNE